MSTDKIIERITKLLSKTEENGATQDEALAAVKMAHKLMAKYNISESDLVIEESVVMEDVSCGTKSVSKYQIFMANELAQHFGCRSFVASRGRSEQIRFIGEKSKVEVLRQTFLFTYRAYQKLWSSYMKNLNVSTHTKNLIRGSYFEGFLAGLTNELIKQENEFGLVIVRSPKVDEFISNLKVNNVKSSVPQDETNIGYLQGYQHGAEAYLSRGTRLEE